MLSIYFKAPFALERVRCAPAGSYLDGFAENLHGQGYAHHTVRKLLCVATHIGHWAHANGHALGQLNEETITAFREHLCSCQCPAPTGGKGSHGRSGAKLFLGYLQATGVSPPPPDKDMPLAPRLARGFVYWMAQHRGVRPSTLLIYERVIVALLRALGDDPGQYSAARLRGFIFNNNRRANAKNTATAVRMFLRYLVVEGKCDARLIDAVPSLARWRRASLPRYLPHADVERIIAVCDARTPMGARDRAILLLLARLGLRAGDIARLRLCDIDWAQGSFRVSGKGRHEAKLPLPQEVGDALLQYLAVRPLHRGSEFVFLRAHAPLPRALSAEAISSVVSRAIARAGVRAPSRGAHLLRHSAATEMLRQGIALEAIAAVLRHCAIETTAHYAKVDQALLRQVVQPWPEVKRC